MPTWKQAALDDRQRIVAFIADDNPMAAIALGDALMEKAGQLDAFPMSGRTGRVQGTRELVVHSHYVLVYRVMGGAAEVLRVLHTSQRWPAQAP